MTTADDLLRPTGQPPSHEEMRGVTVEASIQADKDWQGAWTSTPPSMTEAEHYLTSRRAALENAAQDIYLGAIENASPDQRDSLLQNLHRQHITLTEWATAQAAPILSQNERTALRRDYRTLQRVPHHHQGRRPVDRPRNRRQSLLEIGAGNGYLASELQAVGVDIIPSEPRSSGAEYYHLIPMSPTTCVNMLQATGTQGPSTPNAISSGPGPATTSSTPTRPWHTSPDDSSSTSARTNTAIPAPRNSTRYSKPTTPKKTRSKYRPSQDCRTASSSTNAPDTRRPPHKHLRHTRMPLHPLRNPRATAKRLPPHPRRTHHRPDLNQRRTDNQTQNPAALPFSHTGQQARNGRRR